MKKMTCSIAPRSEPAALTFDAALTVAAPDSAPMVASTPPPPAASAAARKVRRFSRGWGPDRLGGVMARCASLGEPQSAADASLTPSLTATSFRPEMDEHPAEVVGVLLDPVVEGLDLLLVEEAQHPFFQLTASLSWNDLDEPNLLLHRFVDDGAQGTIDVAAAVVDVMEIQLEFHEVARRCAA